MYGEIDLESYTLAIVRLNTAFQKLEDVPEEVNIPEDRVKPLGTSHAVYAARGVINENFATINADDFYGRDAYKVMYDFLSKDNSDSEYNEYAMVGDRLYTDVATGNNAGICSILVLSGEATVEDVEQSEVKPMFMLKDVSEILACLKKGDQK